MVKTSPGRPAAWPTREEAERVRHDWGLRCMTAEEFWAWYSVAQATRREHKQRVCRDLLCGDEECDAAYRRERQIEGRCIRPPRIEQPYLLPPAEREARLSEEERCRRLLRQALADGPVRWRVIYLTLTDPRRWERAWVARLAEDMGVVTYRQGGEEWAAPAGVQASAIAL